MKQQMHVCYEAAGAQMSIPPILVPPQISDSAVLFKSCRSGELQHPARRLAPRLNARRYPASAQIPEARSQAFPGEQDIR